MADLAFYLKINRQEDFALKNLSRWIDVSFLMRADCIIVCDSEELRKRIQNHLLIYSDIRYIKSEKTGPLSYIVDHIANRNWVNASYAHLTTFWHANGKYKKFWNIDADDTRFCVSIKRQAEILKCAQEYAQANDIDCFSLDMWRSETLGRHWSFGVTYVNGDYDWIGLCKERCNDQAYFDMDKEGNQNVDWFFTYLSECSGRRIETFYFENLKYIHYSNDFFEKPVGSGMYHWKNGKLIYPLMYYGLGIKALGEYEIPDDIIRFDVGIQDYEASEILAFYAREGKDLSGFYNIDYIADKRLCSKKFDAFKEKHGYKKVDEPQIICFGAGNALEKNLAKIKYIYDLRYVCDNDSSKWGKEIIEGVTCISPEELSAMKETIVIILVYSRRIVQQIEDQLKNMSVEYDFMDNFFACIE